ncbi:MAG: DUF1684 domain-containing protein, partial [Chloroflexota bacterium]|nr:DUF1684 domain-containing protein [Chloroflexota bacterium]
PRNKTMPDYLDLYDYRCHVAAMYRERNQAISTGEDASIVVERFRKTRDVLFASHPQSALDEEQRRTFQGLHYFPYTPDLCFSVEIDTDVEPRRQQIAMNAEEIMTMTTVGQVSFSVQNEPVALSIYWLNIYGGGLFLPFRDTTSPTESYGSGRYLFDTIKGSDFLTLASTTDKKRILLDFNYAYNPSCAYNVRWVCPLAPVENRLNVAIRAGEMNYKDH